MAMTETTVDDAEVDDAAHAGSTGAVAPAPVLPEVWPKGTDHKYVGSLFVIFSLVFLLAGVVLSLVMRTQLTTADATAIGARSWRMVTMMLTTTSTAAMHTRTSPRRSRSGPRPGRPSLTGTGSLRAQPWNTSDATGAATTMAPPARNSQNAMPWRRGKASRDAPIWRGTMAEPRPSQTGSRKRNTDITPCMVNSWR